MNLEHVDTERRHEMETVELVQTVLQDVVVGAKAGTVEVAVNDLQVMIHVLRISHQQEPLLKLTNDKKLVGAESVIVRVVELGALLVGPRSCLIVHPGTTPAPHQQGVSGVKAYRA
jgi:hypothetical protein